MLLERAIFDLGVKLQKELRDTLIGQKHIATGKLRDSIAMLVKTLPNGFVLEESHQDYGTYVNSGRRAGAKGVPIDALTKWVEVKGIATGKKAISIAWAIRKTIIKQGIPTVKSAAQGKKTAWIDDTLNNNTKLIGNLLEVAAEKDFVILIDNFAGKANKLLSK